MAFTGLKLVLLSFTKVLLSFTGFNWILLDLRGFCWVSTGFLLVLTRFYGFLLGFNGLYSMFQIRFVFQSAYEVDDAEMGGHLARHGDGVKDIAFAVEDLDAIVEVVLELGELGFGTFQLELWVLFFWGGRGPKNVEPPSSATFGKSPTSAEPSASPPSKRYVLPSFSFKKTLGKHRKKNFHLWVPAGFIFCPEGKTPAAGSARSVAAIFGPRYANEVRYANEFH